MADDSDLLLLHAATAGDRDAFGRFVRRNTPVVLRFCLLRIRDRQHAEDAVQEAMLRLYEQVCRQQIPKEPLPWLLGIARRCCQEIQRKRNRSVEWPLHEQNDLLPTQSNGTAVVDVQDAIATLNDFEATVLQLKHTKGLRCRQIGEQLDKPIGTVTAALSRAYKKLRAEFEGEVAK